MSWTANVFRRRFLQCSLVWFTLMMLCFSGVSKATYARGAQPQNASPTPMPLLSSQAGTKEEDPKAHVQQGGIIESIFNYIINATVYFPARTFQEAFEKASTNILAGQLDRIRGPLQEVLNIYAFTNAAVFGNAPIPAEVKQIGQRLTEAAVPIWVLSLVLMALTALTRNASGQPVGLVELAEEGTRWLFVAIASGNGAGIVSWAHTGFGALAFTIASSGGAVTAGEFVESFFPSVALAKAWPLLLLVFATILGFVVIVVLAITYIARYALLFAVTGLAPICIALGGISFTRFAFREWLSTFMRLEFLQLINVTVLVIFKALGFLAASNTGGVTHAVLLITVMLGLSSALIGINVAAFKQVFGTALDVASEMRLAASSLVSSLVQMGGVVAGAALSGGTAALPTALASSVLGRGDMKGSTSGGESSIHNGESQVQGDEALGFGGAMARAWSNATGSAFARGLADGFGARVEQQRQRNINARVEEQQRAMEQRRAESLAREAGAQGSDDIEAIASDITSSESGRTSEQMVRAYRDSAGLLREMAKAYGGPTQAAAVAGYQNFAALARALVEERLQQPSQPADVSQASHRSPSKDSSDHIPVTNSVPIAQQSERSSVEMQSGDSSMKTTVTMPDKDITSANTATSGIPFQSSDIASAPDGSSADAIRTHGQFIPGSLSQFVSQVPETPLRNWVSSPPQLTEPSNQSILPFDFGVGGLLTNATAGDPSHAPLWAKTAYSLRMAYGEDYVQSLLSKVQSEQMDETQLIEQIEQEVATHSSTRPVARFWRPDGGFPHIVDSQPH